MENSYFQYFIGLPGYQTEAPFVPSILVEFRKRLTDDVLSDYLNLARCKKRTSKKIRKAICQQLQYIRRDRKYINELPETECELTQKQAERLAVIDKIYDFDAYNESDVLIAAAERYFERTGHYPERILADKIYRNRSNRPKDGIQRQC